MTPARTRAIGRGEPRLVPSLALLAVLFAWAPEARADVFPPPSRPEWNDPPAPLPAPPDEGLAPWIALAALAAAEVVTARHLRSPQRVVT